MNQPNNTKKEIAEQILHNSADFHSGMVGPHVYWKKVIAALDRIEAETEKRVRTEFEGCYCVCHDGFASRASCKHCEKAIVVAVHATEKRVREEIAQTVGKHFHDFEPENDFGDGWQRAIMTIQTALPSKKEPQQEK